MDQRFHAAVSLLQRAGYVERIHTANGSGVRVLRPKDKELSEFNFVELEKRRQFEHRKLGVMLQYASRFKKHCYRSFILRYFGEWTRVRDCGNCGRCAPGKQIQLESFIPAPVESTVVTLPKKEQPAPAVETVSPEESTIIVLKILSCILRVKEQLGRAKVAKILAGSEDVSIQDFRSLSTYGILSMHAIKGITELIDFLIAEGFVDAGQGLRPVIGVTPKGRQFLKERSPIVLPLVSRAGAVSKP